MSDSRSWKFNEQLPEAFYDALAYVIPASLLFLALNRLFHLKQFLEGFIDFEKDSIVAEVIIGLIVLGILYLVGQFMTSISYFAIALPVVRMQKKLFSDSSANHFSIMNSWFEVRAKNNTGITSEISKRLGRWVMSRNVTFLSFILSIICLLVRDFHMLIISVACFILAIIDFWIRTLWLQDSFNIVLGKAEKSNNKTVKT